MPSSKRSKLVHLTQVGKKDKSQKALLLDKITNSLRESEYCYFVKVENMRNNSIKRLREDLASSAKEDSLNRLYFGKKTIILLSIQSYLGEDRSAKVLLILKELLVGNDIGVMCTSLTPKQIPGYLAQFDTIDFCKGGYLPTETITVPSGVIRVNDEPISHTMEGQLRSAGLPVMLRKGQVVLDKEAVICTQNEAITADQAKILKILDIQLSKFRVVPLAYLRKGKIFNIQ